MNFLRNGIIFPLMGIKFALSPWIMSVASKSHFFKFWAHFFMLVTFPKYVIFVAISSYWSVQHWVYIYKKKLNVFLCVREALLKGILNCWVTGMGFFVRVLRMTVPRTFPVDWCFSNVALPSLIKRWVYFSTPLKLIGSGAALTSKSNGSDAEGSSGLGLQLVL